MTTQLKLTICLIGSHPAKSLRLNRLFFHGIKRLPAHIVSKLGVQHGPVRREDGALVSTENRNLHHRFLKTDRSTLDGANVLDLKDTLCAHGQGKVVAV